MGTKCERCGAKTRGRATYCSGCGNELENKPAPANRKRRRLYLVAAALVVVAAALGGFAAAGGFDSQTTVTASATPDERPVDSAPPSQDEVLCDGADGDPSNVEVRQAVEECFDLSTAAARCVVNSLRAGGQGPDERAAAVAEQSPETERAVETCSEEARQAATPDEGDECHDDDSCAAAEADSDTYSAAVRTVRGGVEFHLGATEEDAPPGTDCSGFGYLQDLQRGTQVVVRDGLGVVIGSTELEQGRTIPSTSYPHLVDCLFDFTVEVPEADVYEIAVGNLDPYFANSQEFASGWRIRFSYG